MTKPIKILLISAIIFTLLYVGPIVIILADVGGADIVGQTEICPQCGSHSVTSIAYTNEYGTYCNKAEATTIKYHCNTCTYYYSKNK